jgi:hypothetical protein
LAAARIAAARPTTEPIHISLLPIAPCVSMSTKRSRNLKIVHAKPTAATMACQRSMPAFIARRPMARPAASPTITRKTWPAPSPRVPQKLIEKPPSLTIGKKHPIKPTRPHTTNTKLDVWRAARSELPGRVRTVR